VIRGDPCQETELSCLSRKAHSVQQRECQGVFNSDGPGLC